MKKRILYQSKPPANEIINFVISLSIYSLFKMIKNFSSPKIKIWFEPTLSGAWGGIRTPEAHRALGLQPSAIDHSATHASKLILPRFWPFLKSFYGLPILILLPSSPLFHR